VGLALEVEITAVASTTDMPMEEGSEVGTENCYVLVLIRLQEGLAWELRTSAMAASMDGT
jgi:hypothetical protein